MKYCRKKFQQLFLPVFIILILVSNLYSEESISFHASQDSIKKTTQQLQLLLKTLQENAEKGEQSLAPIFKMNIEMEALDSLFKQLPIPEKFKTGDGEFLFDNIPLPSFYQNDHKEWIERKGIVKFGGDVLVGRNELVKGDVILFGGDAKIYGKIEGGIVSVFGNIKLASTSEVENEVVTVWGNTITDEGATIYGETVIFNIGNLLKTNQTQKGLPYLILIFRILRFVLLILIAWIIYSAFPKAVGNITHYLKKEYAKSLVFGLIGILLVPIAFLVLLATIIGIPVAIIALPLMTIAAFTLGITGMAILISERLNNHLHINTTASFLIILTGIVVIEIPQLLSKLFMLISPAVSTFFLLIGILVFLIAWMPGFGAVLATRFGKENLPPNN